MFQEHSIARHRFDQVEERDVDFHIPERLKDVLFMLHGSSAVQRGRERSNRLVFLEPILFLWSFWRFRLRLRDSAGAGIVSAGAGRGLFFDFRDSAGTVFVSAGVEAVIGFR